MITSFLQIFRIVTQYRGRLVVSQGSLFISALASVGFATLVGPMVNQGMVGGAVRGSSDMGGVGW